MKFLDGSRNNYCTCGAQVSYRRPFNHYQLIVRIYAATNGLGGGA